MKIVRHDFTILDSTSTWAKSHASSFDPEALTIITAKQQTQGRGRQNKIWFSPKERNIYATFCLFLSHYRNDIINLSQILALSSALTLEKFTVKPCVKWPNDVYIADKKIGGILCEICRIEEKYGLILGIGLNINMTLSEVQQIDRPVTSLFIETGQEYPLEQVMEALQRQVSHDLHQFLKEGFSPFFHPFKERLQYKKEKKTAIKDLHQVWEGIFHSINPDGSINLVLPSQEIRTFFSGEII